jgi:excisionase family DNA binding protein
MAKMFYTLQEAAEKLGVDEEQIKNMAAAGRLQQFRDRDKLMFKREQVDNVAASAGTAADESGSPIPVSGGDTDAIDLKNTESGSSIALSAASGTGTGIPAAPPTRKEDPRQATGISVFDASEVEHADPMAQTQVTSPVADDEELVLESVGSGSGLLDLTRESDDTSLGAELLDEIYPGAGETGGESKVDSAVGSSGVFDGAIAIESGPSGLENLSASGGETFAPATMAAAYTEPDDPAGAGLSFGFLLGAMVSLVIVLIIAMAASTGVNSELAHAIAKSYVYWLVGLGVGSLILGLAFFFVGKSQA